MDILHGLVIVLHFIGWAIVLGGALAGMREARLPKGVLHGALTALVTGVLLVGLLEMGDADVNHIKIGVKLLVTIVISGMVIWGARNEERVTSGFLGGIAGLTALDIALAVLWR